MSDSKPACFGKLPRPEFRGISCGECKRFDGCALETMQTDFGKRGIVMTKETVRNE